MAQSVTVAPVIYAKDFDKIIQNIENIKQELLAQKAKMEFNNDAFDNGWVIPPTMTYIGCKDDGVDDEVIVWQGNKK